MQIISEGGAPGGHNSPGHARTPKRALVGCVPHVGPLTYLFTPHHHLPPENNSPFVGVLGTGVPRLAYLRPMAWLCAWARTAHLHQQGTRPSRGAKPREADDARPPQERPRQAGSRGGGEIKARVPREVLVTQAMTIETRQAPGGRRPAQCPFFPFGAKGASTCQGTGQRLPFRCNKTKTSRAVGRRSPWSPRRRHHQCFWQPKTTFGQDNLY